MSAVAPSITNKPFVASPEQYAQSFVDRRSRLSIREFVQEYQIPRRPVILRDATAAWFARDWTPRSLAARLSHRQVEIRTPSGLRHIRFTELCDQINDSSPEHPAPYARNINIQRDLPELVPDIEPRIPYAVPDWKSSRLMPKGWLFPNGLEELFFGGAGTEFPVLHVDYWGMDGFVSQIYGEKEFILYAPEDTPYLYPSADDELTSSVADLENPDLERFPLFERATQIRIMLEPGDTLYNPNGWWHTARMPGTSITVITATWNRSNWPMLTQMYRRRGSDSKPAKALHLARLIAIGRLLRLRDRLIRGF